jgi:APA family basic amino acid/polyamine antiporter
VAAGSALLSVLVGVSRTGLAMAAGATCPARWPRRAARDAVARRPAGGAVAVAIALLAGPVAAIAVSACSVLVYYAVINLAALQLAPAERRWPRWTSWLGLVLCLGLAALLPVVQVLVTAAALAVAGRCAPGLQRRPG